MEMGLPQVPQCTCWQHSLEHYQSHTGSSVLQESWWLHSLRRYQNHGGGVTSGITRSMLVAFAQVLPQPWQRYLRNYHSHGSITSGITTAMAVAFPQVFPQPWRRYLRYYHSHSSGIPTAMAAAAAAPPPAILPPARPAPLARCRQPKAGRDGQPSASSARREVGAAIQRPSAA